MSFVHLHCHSEYSLLDGANRIDDLIARALELEQPALAITDHGNLHAAWEFQEKAKKAKLKPIIGMEAYVAPGDRRVKGRATPGAKPYYHLVLLARDMAGYKNLVKLSSLAYTEGFYTKPRVDRELLAKYSEGLIVSSACLAGEVATKLEAGDMDGAREAASWYADVFKDRFYLEVQAHDSEGQARHNEQILKLGEDLNLPIVATNDAHFLRDTDHDAHDVLLCIGLGKDYADQNRMHYDRGLYFKSAPEMQSRFPQRPDVLENTLRIADEAGFAFDKKYYVPSFPLPPEVKTEKKEAKELAHAIKRGETTLEQIEAEKAAAVEAARGQRQQPKKSAPRSKRQGVAKPAEIAAAEAAEAAAAEDAEATEPDAAASTLAETEAITSPKPPAPKGPRGGTSKKTKK